MDREALFFQMERKRGDLESVVVVGQVERRESSSE